MITRFGLTAASVLLPLFAFAPAMAGSQPDNARIVVAEYMRAVPAGSAGHCTRVCVKAKARDKAEPICVEWKKVC
jgi:hypothetical protein